MAHRILRRSAPLAALGLLALGPTLGCSIISSDNHVSYTGNYVASDAMNNIRIGESTPAYTEAILGEPTSKNDLDDGTSIWRWDYTERRSSDGSVLLIFDGESSSSKQKSAYVQFKNGVAVKKWRS